MGTAGLSKKRKEELREALQAERNSILAQLRELSGQTADNHGDLGDISSSEWNSELLWELEEHERKQLLDIEDALKRMDEGTYGKCELCGKAIPYARLKVMPTARYTVDCQEQLDRAQGKAPR